MNFLYFIAKDRQLSLTGKTCAWGHFLQDWSLRTVSILYSKENSYGLKGVSLCLLNPSQASCPFLCVFGKRNVDMIGVKKYLKAYSNFEY